MTTPMFLQDGRTRYIRMDKLPADLVVQLHEVEIDLFKQKLARSPALPWDSEFLTIVSPLATMLWKEICSRAGNPNIGDIAPMDNLKSMLGQLQRAYIAHAKIGREHVERKMFGFPTDESNVKLNDAWLDVLVLHKRMMRAIERLQS